MARRGSATDGTLTVQPPTPTGRSPRTPTFVPGVHRRPGRPGFMTREVVDKYMTALRAGSSLNDAAHYAGLNPATVEKWLQRGRGVDTDRPPTAEYVAFARLVDENRATARVFVVGNMVARSAVDTRAAEVWLKVHGGPEWRNPEVYSPDGLTRLPPTPPPGPSVTYDNREQNVFVLPSELIPDTVRAVLAAKRAARVDPPVSEEEEIVHDGPSRTREAGLRDSG